MSLEKKKKENQKVWLMDLLKKEHQDEMCKILAFWEKYKKEWEQLKDRFYSRCYIKNSPYRLQVFFKNLLLQREESEKIFTQWLSVEEREILNSLSGLARDKFCDEYLKDRIFYSWDENKEFKEEGFSYYKKKLDVGWITEVAKDLKDKLTPGVDVNLNENQFFDEWLKILAKEWKHKLQPWMEISLSNNIILDEWVKALAKEWKDSLQPWIGINLPSNAISDEWVEALAKEWKDSLQPGMFINLWNNSIWLKWLETLAREWKDSLQPGMGIILWCNPFACDQWVEILAREWKGKLKPWMTIDFESSEVSSKWVEILAREWKDSLQPGMEISFWANKIWDEWARALMREWKDKLKPGMYVNIRPIANIEISKEVEDEIKNWVQEYKDRWIDCDVVF